MWGLLGYEPWNHFVSPKNTQVVVEVKMWVYEKLSNAKESNLTFAICNSRERKSEIMRIHNLSNSFTIA